MVAADNPAGNIIEEFPNAGTTDVIDDNLGTINHAKTGGTITKNHGCIVNLEGAVVNENCINAEIESFLAGKIFNNSGKVEMAQGTVDESGKPTAVIESNTADGIIGINSGTYIKNNHGTIEENYSVVEENWGNIGKNGANGEIKNFVDGEIQTNEGKVTISSDGSQIIKTPTIGTNSGYVIVESDSKSTVTITNNNSKLIIKSGAKCIVENNTGSGDITVEDGGDCIVNSNSGKISGKYSVPGGTYYKLILKCADSADVSGISPGNNCITQGNDILVLYDSSKQFSDFSLSFDETVYCCDFNYEPNGFYILSGSNPDRDDTDRTFILTFHKYGDYENNGNDTHSRKCVYCNASLTESEQCSSSSGTWESDDTDHWQNCSKCNGKINKAAHIYSTDISFDDTYHWKKCTQEGCTAITGKAQHTPSAGYEHDAVYHWKTCTKEGCKVEIGKTVHDFGEWKITKKAGEGIEGKKERVCADCNYTETATVPAKSPTGGKDKPGGKEEPGKQDNPGGNDNPGSGSTAPSGGNVTTGGKTIPGKINISDNKEENAATNRAAKPVNKGIIKEISFDDEISDDFEDVVAGEDKIQSDRQKITPAEVDDNKATFGEAELTDKLSADTESSGMLYVVLGGGLAAVAVSCGAFAFAMKKSGYDRQMKKH